MWYLQFRSIPRYPHLVAALYLLGADFVAYTDHRPLRSIFTEMANTKIQRWAVLLAEYGAKVQYRQGKNNIRADMLSRIESDNAPSPVPIAILTDAMSEPTDEPESREGGVAARYGLQPREIRRLQHEEYPSEIEEALHDEDSDYTYTLNERVLRSERLPYQGAEEKQRVVLPKSMQEQVVRLAHERGGHIVCLGI